MEIESRVEAVRREPNYAGEVFTEERQKRGGHRRFVGRGWDTHGLRQLNYLVSQGLRPDHTFLDVGAGAFRAGRHLIDYLEPARYYAIDINQSLLEAGYERELSDEQRAKFPVGNVHATDRFDVGFGDVRFDMAIAQSVFTHVSLNNARVCLHRVAKVMKPGGRFFVTFYEGQEGTPIDKMLRKPRRFHERNPYWYKRSDMAWIVKDEPWRMRYIGDWGHPQGQRMLEFTRLTDQQFKAKLARRARHQTKSTKSTGSSTAASSPVAKPPAAGLAAAKSLVAPIRRRVGRLRVVFSRARSG